MASRQRINCLVKADQNLCLFVKLFGELLLISLAFNHNLRLVASQDA